MGNEYPSDYSGWHQAEPSGIPMNDLDPFEIEMLRAAAQRQHQQKGSERIDLNAVMNSEYPQEWVPDLIAELKRYYGFVDELLTYIHHTQLENESFSDLMSRMGMFEEE